jgi:chromosome segregation ATPase
MESLFIRFHIHRNIQVENPVAILDQEESKKFLMGKPEDKYNFFMKATELERVDRTYASTLDRVAELTETNYRLKESLQAAEENKAMLKKKWQEHQAVGRLETKQLKLHSEYAWAYYGQINEEYHSAVQNLETFEGKAAKRQKELAEAEAASTQNGDTEDKREKIDELLAECQNQLALKRDLEEELKAAYLPYKNAERQLAQLKKRQNAAAKMLATAKQRLQAARDEIMANADSAESEEARRTESLRRTEEDLAAARQETASLKQEMSNWLRKYEELEPHVLDATSKCDSLKQKLHGVESTIDRLNSSAGDSLEILGPRVAKVAKLVRVLSQ